MKSNKIHQPQQLQKLPDRMEKQLRQAAKMYEQQFIQEMIRAMRNTIEHSELNEPSMAEKIYTDELYTQYAEKWVENGGNGLADMVYKELREKILPSQTSRYLPSTTAKKEEK